MSGNKNQDSDLRRAYISLASEWVSSMSWSDGSTRAVYDALPKKSVVRGLDELDELIHESFDSLEGAHELHELIPESSDSSEEADNLRKLIQEGFDSLGSSVDASFKHFRRLLEQVRWEFSLFLCRASTAEGTWTLGGPHKLCLAIKDESRVILSGEVLAVHMIGAEQRARALAEEIIGCLIALDLAQHNVHSRRIAMGEMQQMVLRWCDEHGERQEMTWTASMGQAYQASVITFPVVTHRDDLESHRESTNGVNDVIASRMERVEKVYSVGGRDCEKLRTAARFLRRAVAADEPGDAFLGCATLIEGLMVPERKKGDSGARNIALVASEAAAVLLGESFAERALIRELVKKAYKLRSAYVHAGTCEDEDLLRSDIVSIAARLLGAEIALVGR